MTAGVKSCCLAVCIFWSRGRHEVVEFWSSFKFWEHAWQVHLDKLRISLSLSQQDAAGKVTDLPALKFFEFLVSSFCIFLVEAPGAGPERRELDLFMLTAPPGVRSQVWIIHILQCTCGILYMFHLWCSTSVYNTQKKNIFQSVIDYSTRDGHKPFTHIHHVLSRYKNQIPWKNFHGPFQQVFLICTSSLSHPKILLMHPRRGGQSTHGPRNRIRSSIPNGWERSTCWWPLRACISRRPGRASSCQLSRFGMSPGTDVHRIPDGLTSVIHLEYIWHTPGFPIVHVHAACLLLLAAWTGTSSASLWKKGSSSSSLTSYAMKPGPRLSGTWPGVASGSCRRGTPTCFATLSSSSQRISSGRSRWAQYKSSRIAVMNWIAPCTPTKSCTEATPHPGALVALHLAAVQSTQNHHFL